jgi:heat shock protein 5
LGRKLSEPTLEEEIKDLPYNVVEKDGRPLVEVVSDGKVKLFAPEEISSMILHKLKNMAEVHLNQRVKNVVITVPSYFNDNQKQATRNAAFIADLEPLRIITEPTSAGIAYGLDKLQRRGCIECDYVIYNFGTKESDVSMLTVDSGVFEILAEAHDGSLGGDNIDDTLFDYAISHFQTQTSIDIAKDTRAMRSLRAEVIKAEETFLTKSSATIEIQSQHEFRHLTLTVSKKQFQELNKDLFERALTLVKLALFDAKMKTTEVDDIILTGNSKHISRLQPILEAFVGKRILTCEEFSPDEAFVRGAAWQGYALSSAEDNICTVPIPTTRRLSLGIETIGGVFTTIMPRNIAIPTQKRLRIFNAEDNQEKAVIKILEGERAMAINNRLLGTIELTGLPVKPRGMVGIDVMIEVDPDEVITVKVTEIENEREAKLVVTGTHRPYEWEEMERLIVESESDDNKDEMTRKGLLSSMPKRYVSSGA